MFLLALDRPGKVPPGQAISVEIGAKELRSDSDVLVSSCDHGIVLDPVKWQKFIAEPDCEAAIFTIRGFPGTDRTPPSYAYVVPVESGRHEDFPLIQSVSVKVPVSATPSKDALLVGTFWFRSAGRLLEGIDELKKRDLRVNGEWYLDSVFQCYLDRGLKVRMIPLDGYLCWGDPDALAEALYWREIFCDRHLAPRTRFPGIGRD